MVRASPWKALPSRTGCCADTATLPRVDDDGACDALNPSEETTVAPSAAYEVRRSRDMGSSDGRHRIAHASTREPLMAAGTFSELRRQSAAWGAIAVLPPVRVVRTRVIVPRLCEASSRSSAPCLATRTHRYMLVRDFFGERRKIYFLPGSGRRKANAETTSELRVPTGRERGGLFVTGLDEPHERPSSAIRFSAPSRPWMRSPG